MTTLADHTSAAVDALFEGHRAERDFPGWLAHVLCIVAAELGSSYALAEGRPGSWEAEHVLSLVRQTAGHGDEDLSQYRRRAAGG